jgi:hypothetical protein
MTFIEDKIIKEFNFTDLENSKTKELINKLDFILTVKSLDKSEDVLSQKNEDFEEYKVFCNDLESNNNTTEKLTAIIKFFLDKKIDFFKIYEEEIYKLKIQFKKEKYMKDSGEIKDMFVESILNLATTVVENSQIIPSIINVPFELAILGTAIAINPSKNQLSQKENKLRFYRKAFVGLITIISIFILQILLYLVPYTLSVSKVIDKVPNWIVSGTPHFIKVLCHKLF